MRIGEVLSQMELLGLTGLETPQKAEAIANSYRAIGISDGPELQIAFDRWVVSTKKNNYTPRADQFIKYMPGKLIEPPRRYKMDFNKYLENISEVHKWAWDKIIENHGNPRAIGIVYCAKDGEETQMSAAFAPENEWLDRFYPIKQVAKYVKLKMAHTEGFCGIEAVNAAKAAIFPTLAEVQAAKTQLLLEPPK